MKPRSCLFITIRQTKDCLFVLLKTIITMRVGSFFCYYCLLATTLDVASSQSTITATMGQSGADMFVVWTGSLDAKADSSSIYSGKTWSAWAGSTPNRFATSIDWSVYMSTAADEISPQAGGMSFNANGIPSMSRVPSYVTGGEFCVCG